MTNHATARRLINEQIAKVNAELRVAVMHRDGLRRDLKNKETEVQIYEDAIANLSASLELLGPDDD
jgi:septal ring factor EnvC (AmiA/AmiB activator)